MTVESPAKRGDLVTPEQRDVAVRIAGHLFTHPCELDTRQGVTHCGHPGHRDDVEALRQVLALIGLSGPVAPFMTDPVSIAPVVVKRPARKGPANLFHVQLQWERRCSKCREVKAASEFSSGRYECKSCHRKANSKAQARRRARNKKGAPRGSPGRPRKPRPNPVEKECSRCKEPKPLSAFNADKRTPDGLRYDCAECNNARRRVKEAA